MSGTTEHIVTLHDALNQYVKPPKRSSGLPARVPIAGVHNIKGVGDVLTGKVEQGVINKNDDVIFLPSHTATNPCTGRVFSIEMHHKSIPSAECGYNVGLNIKGLNKDYMPKAGDVMILKSDTTLQNIKKFKCQVQVLDHPGELKKGYCPIVLVRTAKAPCRLSDIVWKKGKETNGQQVDNPTYIKANDMACVVFEVDPQHPLIVDKFTNTEGLGRVAIMDGGQATMLGKVVDLEY